MSQGIEHIKASSGLSFGFLCASFVSVIYDSPLNAIFTPLFVGAALSVLLTPDKDVDGGDISYKIIRKLFFTDKIWRIFWKPYSLAYKHRSIYSHGIFISTLIRWIYLVCPGFVQVFYDQQRPVITDTILAQIVACFHIFAIIGIYFLFGWEIILIVFIGNMLGDTLHYLMDINWRILR